MPQKTTDELRFFTELTQVPRPSGHHERINDYLREFAEYRGLAYTEDPAGNVLIHRKGNTRTVVLQGHTDIVANSVGEFDFVNTPLKTRVEGGWITAEGTTLGADDGAGLALMLCALSDPSLEGYDIECLFTVDEEVGLMGAMQLDPDMVSGRMLLNLDEEDEGQVTIGSAGSADIEAVFSFPRSDDNGRFYSMEVSGLLGGHSAGEIGKNRGNAILILAGYLRKFSGVRISSISGGVAPNVIPMSARAVFSVPQGFDAYEAFDGYTEQMHELFDEPGMLISLKDCEAAPSWSKDDTSRFLDALAMCPNGVIDTDGYGVRTSSNVGMVTGDTRVIVKPRSSDTERLEELVDTICAVFRCRKAEAPRPNIFPAWKESEDSRIVRTAVSVYRDYFGREPEVTVTHGGLESSTIKDRYPGMEAVSIGPTIIGAHTPEERMDISSLSRMKGYVFELIRALAR